MRTAILLLLVLSAGCAGRLPPATIAPSAGWVDFGRVRSESTMGRVLDEDHAQFIRKAQEQLDAAVKRKDKDIDTERQQAVQNIQQDAVESEARLLRAIQPIAAALARERQLVTVDLTPVTRLWSAENLTDEVIRRLDAAIADTKQGPRP